MKTALVKIIGLGLIQFIFCSAFAQLSISSNKRLLLKEGKPFFWLGDTAWELFHRTTREEVDQYLKKRQEQGFNVIQAVVLAEMDGLNTPNAYGETPLLNNDPVKPNEKYFQHVDYIIDKAASFNMNIALLPTWGDKIFKSTWGKGPEIFNAQNAALYATWLANRYKNRVNIIWLLGGDRNPRNTADIDIWNAMGKSIMSVTNNTAVIGFHPQPNNSGAAEWFNNEPWLAFNMFQNGHCRDANGFDKILASYNSKPIRPVLDGEPIYEDHPVCFNVKELGTSNALDVRKSAWLEVFAGAFGHTYGCHDIWQMHSSKYEPVNGPHIYWYDAVDLPGAKQMIFLKKLIELFPQPDRIPDQSIISENNLPSADRIQATRGHDYLFVYTSTGTSFTIQPGKITGKNLLAYWYNPKDGKIINAESFANTVSKKYNPPSSGYGNDWVLVMYDDTKQYRKAESKN